MSNLKTCPFCGGKPDVTDEGDYMYVYCTNCGNSTDGHLKPEFGGQCDMHFNYWNDRASGWISVDDRLPDLMDTVLISVTNDCVDGLVGTASFQYGDRFIDPVELMRSRNPRECVGVTHWMPLPEPPTLK